MNDRTEIDHDFGHPPHPVASIQPEPPKNEEDADKLVPESLAARLAWRMSATFSDDYRGFSRFMGSDVDDSRGGNTVTLCADIGDPDSTSRHHPDFGVSTAATIVSV